MALSCNTKLDLVCDSLNLRLAIPAQLCWKALGSGLVSKLTLAAGFQMMCLDNLLTYHIC